MIEKKSANEFLVKGILGFDNVNAVLNQACDFLSKEKTASQTEIIFNFAELQQSNSASLALLTALLRYAREHQYIIQFLHLPSKLWAAAKISDLDKILPCV